MNLAKLVSNKIDNIDSNFTNKSYNSISHEYFQEFGNSFNGNNYTLSTATIDKAYQLLPILPTIINRKSLMFNNGRISLLNTKGETVNDNRLTKLLSQPNPLQTGSQFISQSYALSQIYGVAVWLIVKPFNNIVGRMYVLPNQFLQINYKQTSYLSIENLSDLIESVYFTYNGETTQLNKEDLYFCTDTTLSIDSPIFPQSRITPLGNQITNLVANYEARGVLINSRGALGILSNDSKDVIGTTSIDAEDKQLLQEDYKKYGLSKSQWQVIITNMSLKWQRISMDVDQLKLFENEKSDIQTICDAFGFNYNLLSNADGTTFNNQNAYEKAMYQNTIIPESENILFQFNEATLTFQNGYQFIIDYSHLPIFQDNQKEKAEIHRINVLAFTEQFLKCAITHDALMLELKQPIRQEFVGKYLDELPQLWDLYKINNTQNDNINGQGNQTNQGN
jgi:phage portal protein BeeE